jgi:predicted RNA-binding Zn-ribbon protein involved in translation (DUF1610 family)
MQDYSEVPTDTGPHNHYPDDWQGDYTSTLFCIACGSQFEVSSQQPRVRCPVCGTVGYTDRAGRNLVSTDWDCLDCGTRNPETTNFCFECGHGLTTRCLRCEFPVYTSICHRCGSPQDKLLRMQAIQQDRAEWIPIQRSVLDEEQRRIEAQRAKQEKQGARERKRTRLEPEPEPASRPVLEADAAPQINTADWQSVWPQVDQARRLARQQRSQKRAQRRRAGNPAVALAFVVIGVAFLLYQFQEPISGWLATIQQTPTGTAVVNTFNSWYSTMQTVIASRGTVDTASPEYAAFFAVTVFSIAAIPVLIYLLSRVVRWVFR